MAMTREDRIYAYLQELGDYELIRIWNNAIDDDKVSGDLYNTNEIHEMYEFDDMFDDMCPLDIVRMAQSCDFDPDHSYFVHDEYGDDVESFDYVSDYVDISELASSLSSNEASLDDRIIQTILECFDADGNVDIESMVKRIASSNHVPADYIEGPWFEVPEATPEITAKVTDPREPTEAPTVIHVSTHEG